MDRSKDPAGGLRAVSSRPEFDLHFYFDPVCPFAWMTSKWVRMVAAQRDYRVDWRFISLRLLNVNIDYARTFRRSTRTGTPPACGCCGSPRRCAREHGRAAVGRALRAIGSRIFDTPP